MVQLIVGLTDRWRQEPVHRAEKRKQRIVCRQDDIRLPAVVLEENNEEACKVGGPYVDGGRKIEGIEHSASPKQHNQKSRPQHEKEYTTYIAAHGAVPSLVRVNFILVRLQTMEVDATLAGTVLGLSVLQHILRYAAGAQFATVNGAVAQLADFDGGGWRVLRFAHFQRKALKDEERK